MTRGVKQGIITSKALLSLLALDKNTKAKKLDLLDLALEKDLIDIETYEQSVPRRESCIKCYLKSVIGNDVVFQRCQDYVEMASLLYTRGSIIANFVALSMAGVIQTHDKNKAIPWFENNERYLDVYRFVEDDVFKHCFLPERWPSKDAPRNERVEDILNKHHDELATLLPDWKSLMKTSGWDNVINRMYSKYRGNVENHVCHHLLRYTKNYLQQVELEDESSRSLLCDLIFKPLRVVVMHNQDYEGISKLCQLLEKSIEDYLPKKVPYNDNTFSLAMFYIQQGIANSTFLPFSSIGRKYCYIDLKVATYLFNEKFKEVKKRTTTPTLANIMGLTPNEMRQRRKLLRKQFRRKYKDNKKLKKKWKKIGFSTMPRNAEICSVETDGVGLSICMKLPITKVVVRHNVEDINNPVFMGADFGRAKIAALAVSTCPWKKPETILLTRRQYYYETKHHIRKRWERGRNENPNLKNILVELSGTSKSDRFHDYVSVMTSNLDVLKDEYLDNVERYLWKMRLYRLKKRCLDSFVSKVYNAAKGRDIVFGFGDCNFPCTGKGEKSVPTKQIMKAFEKKRRHYHSRVVGFKINEFRTTLGCSSCGRATVRPLRQDGKQSGRLRLCSHCNETTDDHSTGLRDRDVQAARNMLWLTWYEYYGSERPWYMSRNQLMEP